MGEKKSSITAKYEKESKRYRRFSIAKNTKGIVGTIYLEKGRDLPENLFLKFEEE